MTVTKNQLIPLSVIELKSEVNGHWSVYFKRPPHFVFETGDWIDILFKNRQLKGGITYSLSSSPTESDLRITFRHGISEFKQALQSVAANDQLFITQFGNSYDFQLNKHRSSVLIAGGVGITPFRSMIKEMYDNADTNEVTLIYLNQSEDFLFKDEFDMWQKHLPHLSIMYICTKEINRKKRERLIKSYIKNPLQNFYISGPPGMVDSNEHLLIDMGVRVQDIRIDSFGGY